MSFLGDWSDNEGLILSSISPSTCLAQFTIKSPLTHCSLSMFVANVFSMLSGHLGLPAVALAATITLFSKSKENGAKKRGGGMRAVMETLSSR